MPEPTATTPGDAMPPDYVTRDEYLRGESYVRDSMTNLRELMERRLDAETTNSERIVRLEVQMGGMATTMTGVGLDVKALGSQTQTMMGKVDGLMAAVGGRREKDAKEDDHQGTVKLALKVALAALAIAALLAGAYKVGNSSSVTVAPEVLQQAVQAVEAAKAP